MREKLVREGLVSEECAKLHLEGAGRREVERRVRYRRQSKRADGMIRFEEPCTTVLSAR